MKKIFLDHLPHGGKGISLNKVNWKKSIGCEIPFIFNNIEGKLKIINYYKKNNDYYLDVKYNIKEYEIRRTDFTECKIAIILGVYNHKYKYKVGDIITDVKSGKLEILGQIRMGKNDNKGYKYKCLVCENEDIIFESNLLKKYGCNVCCNTPRKVIKGINDVATINPHLASLFVNKEDTYKYTEGSSQSIDFKCPNCGYIIKNKKISEIKKQGLSCPKCSDNVSFGQKILFNILIQLNLDFDIEKMFNWSSNKRYDFYFKINNNKYIIEVNGLQHYQEEFSRIKSSKRAKTLEEEQENDRLKKELAIDNGINKNNYLVIDCRKSELEYIKNNIIKSKLNNIFDLSKIDWLKCYKYACSSLVKQACDLWNSGIHSTTKIGKIMKLSRTTIYRYLKTGSKLKLCDYTADKALNYKNKNFSIYGIKNRKKVICLNNNKIFDSCLATSKYYDLKSVTSISNCCKGKTRYAGTDPITGEKLHWMYYDEYVKNKESNI